MGFPLEKYSLSIEVSNRRKGLRSESFQKLKRERVDYSDADYKFFLDHLRVEGKSYAFEMTVGDTGSTICLKYETEDDFHCSDVIHSPCRSSGESISSKGSSYKGKKKSKKEFLSPNWSERLISDSSVDENYRIFLDHLRLCNGLMVLELDNNITIEYEGGEEEETLSENENLVKDSNFSSTEMELHPSNGSPQPSEYSGCGHDGSSIEKTVRNRVPSSFRNRLMEILRKPFNQREYDKMMKLATIRTPLMKLKHLRRMSIPYATNELGLSYFDHYPDLAKQIECADHHRGLTLLRGFFFWLKNLGHEGAFMPWSSPSFRYETMPSGSYNMSPL